MAESAISTRLHSVSPQLEEIFPDQLSGRKSFKSRSQMTAIELLFSLICNTALFGAPLFKFLVNLDKLDEYIKSREETLLQIKCMRLDIEDPPLTLRISILTSLLQTINEVQTSLPTMDFIHWFFVRLTTHSEMTVNYQLEILQNMKSLADYANHDPERVEELNYEELSKADVDTLPGTYFQLLTQIATAIKEKFFTLTGYYLFFTEAPDTLYADSVTRPGIIQIQRMFLPIEREIILKTLKYPRTYQAKKPATGILEVIAKANPSRFHPDASLGFKNYHQDPKLMDLDWIDTQVDPTMLTDLSVLADNRIQPAPQSPTLNRLRADDLVDEPPSPADSETRARTDTISTIESNSTHTTIEEQPNVTPPKHTKASGTGRLGRRERERQYLLGKSTAPTTPLVSKAKSDTNLPSTTSTHVTGKLSATSTKLPNDTEQLQFRISSDSCKTILDVITKRFKASFLPNPGSMISELHLPEHLHRFTSGTLVAQQIVKNETLPTDIIITMSPSSDSVRYIVTFDSDTNCIIFNRVHYYRWTRWS